MKILKLLQPYLVRHWFKLCVVGFLVFLFLQKELSFRLQLTAPVRQEQTPPPPAPESESREQNTVLTDQASAAPVVTDRLQLFGSSSETMVRTAGQSLAALEVDKVQAFTKRFAHVAETEQDKYGIPASIILASSLLHSQAGTTELCRQSHNYFSLSCSTDWAGPTEDRNGQCYRSYNNAWTSFRDHSLFLTTGPLSYLQQYSDRDYPQWARELEKIGFSKEKDLAKQLVSIIERYELHRYD